jgi:hypothetical protein
MGLYEGNGVDLVEMVTRVQKITSREQLPSLVLWLRAAGDSTSADFIENWQLSLEYYVMSEWSVNPVTDDPHPISYPDCVKWGCKKHPWIT